MNVTLHDLFPPDVAILANGEPPCGAVLELFLASKAYVACDGAWRAARTLGREPDFVVGDGDSIAAEEATALGGRLVRISEQETNDLAKAFRFSCVRFPASSRLVIFGAGGGREDHFIGNVSRLAGFAKEWAGRPGADAEAQVALVTNAGRFDVVSGVRTFSSEAGDAVSVFSPHLDAHVYSEGLEWPLDGVALDEPWKGTLNRAAGSRFTLRSDRPIVLYRPFGT